MTFARSRRWHILATVWAAAILAVWPVLFHWTAPAPDRSATLFAAALAVVAAALLGHLFYRAEKTRLQQSQRVTLLVFIFLLTAFCEYAHHFFVDHGFYDPGTANAAWQARLQGLVVHLDPSVLPHSYRFLPNAIVFWLQIFGVDFAVASEIFRSLTGLVVFYALYRFGRLYTTYLGTLIAMILVGLVYPVSFISYAGQLTDPLSHLSFLLAFIFLETDDFLFFLSALLIGSLAKETVLCLLGFYLLFFRRQRGYLWKAPTLILTCLTAYFGIRTFVLHGVMQYNQVSGVRLWFIKANIKDPFWMPHLILTGLAYLPFLILGWKGTPLMLKRMFFYLLPLLLVTSGLFSWLNEARNYMPLVFVLAVVSGRYLVSQASGDEMQEDSACYG